MKMLASRRWPNVTDGISGCKDRLAWLEHCIRRKNFVSRAGSKELFIPSRTETVMCVIEDGDL